MGDKVLRQRGLSRSTFLIGTHRHQGSAGGGPGTLLEPPLSSLPPPTVKGDSSRALQVDILHSKCKLPQVFVFTKATPAPPRAGQNRLCTLTTREKGEINTAWRLEPPRPNPGGRSVLRGWLSLSLSLSLAPWPHPTPGPVCIQIKEGSGSRDGIERVEHSS
jgi:hypothetical protein